jgi:hypothetical protein
MCVVNDTLGVPQHASLAVLRTGRLMTHHTDIHRQQQQRNHGQQL